MCSAPQFCVFYCFNLTEYFGPLAPFTKAMPKDRVLIYMGYLSFWVKRIEKSLNGSDTALSTESFGPVVVFMQILKTGYLYTVSNSLFSLAN